MASAAIAAAGAMGIAFAPPASAALVQGVTVDSLPGYGSSANGSTNTYYYGTGCEYKVEAIVRDFRSAKSNLKIVATSAAGSKTLFNGRPTGTVTTAKWRPAARGTTTLSATLDGVTTTSKATVGSGVEMPFFIRNGACFVLP